MSSRAAALTEERQDIMQGTLSQISLTDALQLAVGGKKSGLLRFSRGKEVVDVFLVKGDIIHATCPIGEGDKALLYPVTWSEGTFVLLTDFPTPSRAITKQPEELLAEVMAVSQEWERIRQIIPTEKTVFRITDLGETRGGAVSIPQEEWRILSKIDGFRDVQGIAEILRLTYFETAKVISNFQRAGLVEVVPTSAKAPSEAVSPRFFDRMIRALTEAMGPMASVVVRDQIAALGESKESFPKTRLAELVESVSQEILDQALKMRFQQLMVEEIRTLKKL